MKMRFAYLVWTWAPSANFTAPALLGIFDNKGAAIDSLPVRYQSVQCSAGGIRVAQVINVANGQIWFAEKHQLKFVPDFICESCQRACPTCGHCSHCGRNATAQPVIAQKREFICECCQHWYDTGPTCQHCGDDGACPKCGHCGACGRSSTTTAMPVTQEN